MTTIDYRQIRKQALDAREALKLGTKRNSKSGGLYLCERIIELADALEALDRRQVDTFDRLEQTRQDWNELVTLIAQRFGVEVWSRDEGVWNWRCGKEEGSAATVVRAIVAGLAASGAKRAAPPPLDQQLRQAGAPELPGFAAEQARRHGEKG